MGSLFFQKSVAMVWVPLFVFIVGGVFYVVIEGYHPKVAIVEAVEDVIEYETGIEVDLNDFEPEKEEYDSTPESKQADFSLKGIFFTEVFPGDPYNPR